MASTPIGECRRAAYSREEETHVELWTTLIPEVLKDEGKAAESSEAIADLAMHELPRISSSQSLQLASRGVLRAALESSVFQKAFAGAFLKATTASGPGIAPNELLILVHWSCLLMESLGLEAGPKPISKLIEIQNTLLQRMAAAKRGRARTAACIRLAGAALRGNPQLVSVYLDVLKATSSPFIAWVLVTSDASASGTATLETFCGEKVLGAKEGLSAVELSAWRQVAPSWTPEMVTGRLVPSVERSLKRSPEIGLCALLSALQGAGRRPDGGLPAAALVEPLIAPIIALAKHAKDTVRAAALRVIECAGTVLPAGSNARFVGACAALDLVAGKGPEGRIKGVAERGCLARAASALAPTCNCYCWELMLGAENSHRPIYSRYNADDETIAVREHTVVATLACEAYAKEPHDDGKAELLGVVGSWAVLATEELPSPVVQRLTDAIQEGNKEGPRRAGLLAACSIATSTHLIPCLAPKLAPVLAKLVTDGASKAALRQDGVLAGLALARMCTSTNSGEASHSACSKHAPTLASAVTSTLGIPATVAKLPAPAAAAAADLAMLVLRHSFLGLDTEAENNLYRSVALLALHSTPGVSQVTLNVVREAVRDANGVAAAATSAGVLRGLLYWADHANDANLQAITAESESNTMQSYRARFLRAMRAALPVTSVVPSAVSSAEEVTAVAGAAGAELVSADALATLALLAHGTPLENVGSNGSISLSQSSATWRALLGGRRSPLRALLESEAEALGAESLRLILAAFISGTAPQPEASLGAVRALVALNPAKLLPTFFDANLLPSLHSASHDALRPLQVRTYFTPSDKLASETAEGGIMPAEVLERVLASGPTGGAQPRPLVATTEFLRRPQEETTNEDAVSAVSRDTMLATKQRATSTAKRVGAPHNVGKPSTQRGGNVKPSSSSASDARRRQLESEERERKNVHAIVFTLSRALLALAAAAYAGADTTLEHLELLSAPILPLLASPVVGGEGAAFQALVALASCLPAGLQQRASDIAAAVSMVVVAEKQEIRNNGSDYETPLELPLKYQSLLGQRAFVSALHALQRAVGGVPANEETEGYAGDMPLPAPAARFVFPILRATLSAPEATALHGTALDVLSLHTNVLPVPDVLRLLYGTLETLPALSGRIAPLLRKICSGIDEEHEEPLKQQQKEAIAAALEGLRASRPGTRSAALGAIRVLPGLALGRLASDTTALCVLWVACSDPNADNAAAGLMLWDLAALPESKKSNPTIVSDFVDIIPRSFLVSGYPDVRVAGAGALAAALLKSDKENVARALNACITLFEDAGPNGVAAQLGAAMGLEAIAPQLTLEQAAGPALRFVLSRGLLALDPGVRDAVIRAGAVAVDSHGAGGTDRMLPLFEAALADPGAAIVIGDIGGGDVSKTTTTTTTQQTTTQRKLSEEERDFVRQGVIVLLGTLARHLPPESPKVRDIISTLIGALDTPSEAVQRRSADCLPALVQLLHHDRAYVEGITKQLLDRCLHAKGYAERRGAAFGLAGVVKGLGIGCLKALGILDALKAAMDGNDKGSSISSSKAKSGGGPTAAREGALMAYERLSARLGRLFEPYVTSLLPSLLAAFGDGSAAVRSAAEVAAREIMVNLSAQGVRLVLPGLLGGLEETSPWRTKQASIQLLGATAHLNPRQLGSALPSVVPRLGAALSDAHPRVAAAASDALREVAAVIRNPEVTRLVPDLLNALADPAKHTRKALDLLLSTVFVNTVDAASLALIMPIVRRGLRDRSGDGKKRSARIVGSLCGLANDPGDMAPYVADLLPDLRTALIDPLPEVRATAARALGALVRGMDGARGDLFVDLVPDLVQGLQADTNSVERSGAAQGLAEVLAVRGSKALEALLPRILQNAHASSAAAREGSITLLKYLPGCMPDKFRAFLAQTLPCILRGLADESEGVRDASLSAARVCVDLYANTSLELLLPTVEAGIRNASWRIRQSSIELLGDLLFKLAGTSGRIQQDLHDGENEGIGSEAHGAAITESLGAQRRAEVLAAVYLSRSDEAAGVRASALHVWKTLVSNTPRTLGEILPQLMDRVIEGLADSGEDGRAAAGRCLGELVRKMGDRVLRGIVPILKKGMSDTRAHIRQGVCNGLRDVLENADREQLAQHLPELLPAVQAALCDPSSDVRLAAGSVFGVLSRGGGASALDTILPPLLAGLDGHSSEDQARALEGLRVVLGVRPNLLGSMIPKLLKPPPTAAKLRALGALCEVAGTALHAQISSIVPALLTLANQHPDVSPAVAAAHDALRGVVLAVQEDGLYTLIGELLKGLENSGRRRGAAAAIAILCRGGGKADPQEHLPALINALVPCLVADENNPDDEDDVRACWEALSATLTSIPKELQPNYVRALKDAVLTARDKERRHRRERGLLTTSGLLIAGFCLPKAIGPLLPIYLQGILQGSAELRETAAEGLGQLVEVTSEETLRPYVVQSTGPLIRIIGDRFPWQVKAAILRTLGTLIKKAGLGLKPFVPQLQTTFVKCLLDPEPRVRELAASNLGGLSALSPRLDALLVDLASSARAANPATAATPYLSALENALRESGCRASHDALSKVGAAVQDTAQHAGDEEDARQAAAGALGALCACVPPHEARALLLNAGSLGRTSSSTTTGDRLGAALTATAAARYAPELVRLSDADADQIVTGLVAVAVQRFGRDPHVPIRQAAARLAALIVMAQLGGDEQEGQHNNNNTSMPRLVSLFVSLLGSDQDSDVQRTAVAALRKLAGSSPAAPETLAPHYADLVPSLLAVISDSVGSTRLNAERTLARVLGMAGGDESLAREFITSGAASPAVARQLTDAYLRRLAKLPPGDEDEFEEI